MIDPKHAFRAGLVVIIGVAIGIAFFVATRKSTLDGSNSAPYYALMSDVSGVNAKSLITVAGLQVGEIQDIFLTTVTLEEFAGHERKALEAAYKELTTPGLDPAEARIKRGEYDSLHSDWVRVYGATAAEKGAWESMPDVEEDTVLFTRPPKPPPAWEPKKRVPVARVEMRVVNNIKIPMDTWVKKESLGLLGANALFLDLGQSDEMVAPGERLKNVRSQTALGALQEQAGTIVASVESIVRTVDRDLGGIVGDVKDMTGELSRFMQGDGENPPLDELYQMVLTDIRKVVQTVDKAIYEVNGLLKDNDKAVTGLLANMERISGDLADLTGEGTGGGDGGPGDGDLRQTIVRVREITDDLADVTGTLKDVIGENEDDVNAGVAELKNTLGELNRSLSSLAEVTGRVERGEGTVGRLLTDERMADRLEEAVAGASDFVTGLTSMETHVDLGTWYSVNRASTNVAFELRLQPKPDKYYLIGIVDDGGGIERLSETVSTITGNQVQQRTTIREDDNSLRITAMFAKRFWDFLVLRVGLLETSGAVGMNLLFWDDRIELRSDMFNFGAPRHALSDSNQFLDENGDPAYPANALPYLPRWRTMLKFQPIPHVYAVAGVDDVLNFSYTPQTHGFGFDYFFGAGLTFQDEDLRSILPFVPSF
jgi:phospholipid/cholesterol/gamma-HCH transport system substrate-binding protein